MDPIGKSRKLNGIWIILLPPIPVPLSLSGVFPASQIFILFFDEVKSKGNPKLILLNIPVTQ